MLIKLIVQNFISDAQRTARRSIWTIFAAIFLLIGIAFLIAAGWVALADWQNPIVASLVFGASFVILGLIILLFSNHTKRRSGDANRDLIMPLVNAFMTGFNKGVEQNHKK